MALASLAYFESLPPPLASPQTSPTSISSGSGSSAGGSLIYRRWEGESQKRASSEFAERFLDAVVSICRPANNGMRHVSQETHGARNPVESRKRQEHNQHRKPSLLMTGSRARHGDSSLSVCPAGQRQKHRRTQREAVYGRGSEVERLRKELMQKCRLCLYRPSPLTSG